MSPATASTSCRAAGSQLATTFICSLVAEHRDHRRRGRACDRDGGGGRCAAATPARSRAQRRARSSPPAHPRQRRDCRRSCDDIVVVRLLRRRSPRSIRCHTRRGGATGSTSSASGARRPRQRATSAREFAVARLQRRAPARIPRRRARRAHIPRRAASRSSVEALVGHCSRHPRRRSRPRRIQLFIVRSGTPSRSASSG